MEGEVPVLQEQKPAGIWPLIHLQVQTDRSICFYRRRQPAIHSTSHQTIAIGDGC